MRCSSAGAEHAGRWVLRTEFVNHWSEPSVCLWHTHSSTWQVFPLFYQTSVLLIIHHQTVYPSVIIVHPFIWQFIQLSLYPFISLFLSPFMYSSILTFLFSLLAAVCFRLPFLDDLFLFFFFFLKQQVKISNESHFYLYVEKQLAPKTMCHEDGVGVRIERCERL